MKCNIYGIIYKIRELPHDEFYDNLGEKDKPRKTVDDINLGRHLAIKQEILLNEDLYQNTKKASLIHEITHAIIFVLGYGTFEEYTEEGMCTFMAAQLGIINNIVKKYFKEDK